MHATPTIQFKSIKFNNFCTLCKAYIEVFLSSKNTVKGYNSVMLIATCLLLIGLSSCASTLPNVKHNRKLSNKVGNKSLKKLKKSNHKNDNKAHFSEGSSTLPQRLTNQNLQYYGKDLADSSEKIEISKMEEVAVLLPFSKEGMIGKVALAIRNGILYKYYKQIQDGKSKIEKINFFDTSSADIKDLYKKATNGNPNVIVLGPLLKSKVQEIVDMDTSLPVIAANIVSEDGENSSIYQFSLTSSQESAAIAERMYLEGYTSVAVIGVDTKWGARTIASFTKHFEKLGGTVVAKQEIESNTSISDLRSEISNLVQVSDAQVRDFKIRQRILRVKKIAQQKGIENNQKLNALSLDQEDEKLQNEIHRREDIDAIFLATTDSKARMIKPLLSYYLANDLKLYATSQIYSGWQNPIKNSDLNTIVFVDMPWTLHSSNDKNQVLSLWGNHAMIFSRLYAMGIDMLSIAPLVLKNSEQKTQYSGVSGKLIFSKNQKIIQRVSEPAKFSGGVATSNKFLELK